MSDSMRAFKRMGLVVILLTAAAGLTAAVVKDGIFTPFDKEFYLTDEQVAFIRPGFDVEIVDHAIADDGTVSVVYTIKDSGGLPLDINGVYTPGSINISFLIASIPADKDHYVAYATRSVTSSITGVTAIQPTSDSGGTTEEIEIGTYRYTFGKKLPQGYDRDATHSIGFYSQRSLSEFELTSPMDDGVVTFVPSGAEVEKIRQVSTDAACAKCHDFLQVHGRRHSLDLCIMCHYDGVIDPDTENSVDMPIMAHKIHAGASLEHGYVIIGYQNSVHDYSNVEFPQDLRYCDTCHVEEAAQNEAWYLKPTRAACGACHDSVNFASGENHAGGSAISDNFCANCHFPEGELEFDASIKGAHTIPTESKELTGVVVDILDVTSGGPGTAPSILFTVTDKAGLDIPLPELDRLRFQIAGPTTDYSGSAVREDALAAAVPAGSIQMESGMMATQYVYTCQWVIPEDAEGTYAIGPEARTVTTLYPGTSSEQTNVRDTSENPVFYFAVTDEEATPRRMIVDDAKCETCHRNLALHGGGRHNAAEYCQFCHNPPEGAISFQFMVHRIHMGEELTRDFTIGRANFNEVRYPSNRANCEKCHLEGTYNVPVAGVLPMTNEDEFFSPIPPNSTACLGCHDTVDAAAHAFTNISPFGEGCGACHAAEREFAVAKLHAN